MNRLRAGVKTLASTRDRGVTAAEYALILVGIFLLIVTAVTVLGTTVRDLYETYKY